MCITIRIVCNYGRAVAAWCLLIAFAPVTNAQDAAFDGPPPGMDPPREMQFTPDGTSIISDEGVNITDGGFPDDSRPLGFGPQVGPQSGGAAYNYVEDQGLPYIMQQEGVAAQAGEFYDPLGTPPPPSTYWPMMTRLGFRHSYTHGRNVGWGQPLVGSSCLNRPYYYGATLGPMWLTNRPAENVPRDVDLMGSLFFGWDWDYYWGSEIQYAYATPELVNTAAPPDSPISARLVSWNYSFMYYPWGDSNLRPYWRLGVGDTKFDFPTDDGLRRDEWLFTTPFGVGLKYSLRRWLAARIEFTDQYSWGSQGVASQHNLTLSFGLESRFGGKRKAYWPWNPSRHIW